MRLLARALAACAVVFSSACAPPTPPADAGTEAQAIRDLVTAWNGYLAAKNDSAIGALYAADAVLMPPNTPKVTGPAAIQAYFAQLWPLNATLTVTSTDVKVAGDLGIEEGTYAMNIPLPDGGEQRDTGKYLVAWRKQDGQWKVVQDIWNSDNPPPPAAPAAPQ